MSESFNVPESQQKYSKADLLPGTENTKQA